MSSEIRILTGVVAVLVFLAGFLMMDWFRRARRGS